MHAPDFQTGIFAGLWGFIAAASSVLGRMQDGHGRSSSLSIFESSIVVTEYIMFELFVRGDIMRRIGVNRFWPTFPVGIYETKQGWLGVTTVTPAQWRAFCEMLGLQDLRDDATLFMGVDRLQRMEEIESQFIPKLKQRTAQEWFAEGLRRKIPIVPVPGIGDLIGDAEKRSRGADRPDHDRQRGRVYRRFHAAPDRYAAAARRSRSRHRRGAACHGAIPVRGPRALSRPGLAPQSVCRWRACG